MANTHGGNFATHRSENEGETSFASVEKFSIWSSLINRENCKIEIEKLANNIFTNCYEGRDAICLTSAIIGTLFETLWLEKVNYSENDFTKFVLLNTDRQQDERKPLALHRFTLKAVSQFGSRGHCLNRESKIGIRLGREGLTKLVAMRLTISTRRYAPRRVPASQILAMYAYQCFARVHANLECCS